MDTTQLRPFSPVSIPRSVNLNVLNAETVPPLDTLRGMEKDLQEYKRAIGRRLEVCEEVGKVVEDLYSALKDKDRSRVKGVKKEPVVSDGLSNQPPRPKQPTALRIPPPTTMSSSTSPVPPTLPASSLATPVTKPTPIVRAGSAALPSNSASTSSKNKNKKRRRPEDEEFNDLPGGVRGPTPAKHGHKEHKSKKARLDDDLRTTGGFRRITDWSESIKGGLPPKPPRNPISVPQTDDPGQVSDDFSDRKQPPNQVTAHAYWNYIEPWIRQVKDEDVAFLAFSADDEEYWEMPALGRHYSEIWEEQDRTTLGLAPLPPHKIISATRNPYSAWTDPLPPASANPAIASTSHSHGHPNIPPPNKGIRWDPATLTEADLMTEEHGSGPLTERVFSSFLYMPGSGRGEEDAGAASTSGMGALAMKGGAGMGRGVGQGTVGDLEERLMKECKALGLILDNEEPDYSQPQDDQIASELRRCQRALKAQIAINEARKRRLLSIAELRLSYAEYEETKEGIEKTLSNHFSRLGNTGVPKVTKKKKKEKEKVAGQAAVSTTGEMAGINGLGLVGMDGGLLVTNEIVEVVGVLKRWMEIGSAFDRMEKERPGLIAGLPKKSIYEGLEGEVGEVELEKMEEVMEEEGPVVDSDEDVLMDGV